MKFTNRRIANTIIISTLLVASIASIGFSSWLLGGDSNNNASISFEIGDVNKVDLGNAAYYVKDSEIYFSYYSIDDKSYANKDSISIKIKINPSLIEQNFSDDLYVDFGLTYSYRTSLNRDLFGSNTYSTINSNIIFALSDNNNIVFNGGTFIYSSSDIGNSTTRYSIVSKTLLFSKTQNSIWNYFKYFGNNTEISIDVIFKFNIIDPVVFKTMTTGLSINVFTSLGGK